MTIKSTEVEVLLLQLNEGKNSGLSTKSLTMLIKLIKHLTQEVSDLSDAQKALMESYGIKANEGAYFWDKHEKAKEINEKVRDFALLDVKINPVNFMTEDELSRFTIGMTMKSIIKLSDILLSHDKETQGVHS